MAKKLLLKNLLFNEKKVTQIAQEIQTAYPKFNKTGFTKTTVQRFPELELKQRISWIRECLRKYLPDSYREAVEILLLSLPKPNNPDLSDDDFGDFIYAPYAEYVAIYGCNKNNLHLSLSALREITQRFSAEDAIRYFINTFPRETLAELLNWTKDPHYHVRRLTSEGTRPKLPWSQKIIIPIEDSIPILDNLFADRTRFVTRSVANHLNDISKINPDLVLEILKTWQDTGKQNSKEMGFIISHSLRTLIKQGYSPAFAFLQFSNKVKVTILNFEIENDLVKIGTALSFSITLKALKSENLLIDYRISFQNKKGEMNSNKVYKLKKVTMVKDQTLVIKKNHRIRKHMTTRTIYPGKHQLEIQINGIIVASNLFEVLA